MIIGRHFPVRDGSGRHPGALSGVALEKFARRLGLLVNRVADDVGQHQARIAQVNRELSEAERDDAARLTEAVLGALAKMVESDARLQERLAKAEQRLQQQAEQIQAQLSEARTDPLTELPNRRAFGDELERQIAEWHRKGVLCSLLMIDVDHFKKVNDRYGHAAGDQVLRDMGDVLKGVLREMDMVARVGGEEFAAILPSTTLPQGVCAAQRVRKAVAAHVFRFEQIELHLTISLGLAVAEPRDNGASLIRRADDALYASKNAGRNCGHLHDGTACRPLDSQPVLTLDTAAHAPPAITAEPSTSDAGGEPVISGPPQSTDDEELHAACQDLRARLIEVTANSGASAHGSPAV